MAAGPEVFLTPTSFDFLYFLSIFLQSSCHLSDLPDILLIHASFGMCFCFITHTFDTLSLVTILGKSLMASLPSAGKFSLISLSSLQTEHLQIIHENDYFINICLPD